MSFTYLLHTVYGPKHCCLCKVPFLDGSRGTVMAIKIDCRPSYYDQVMYSSHSMAGFNTHNKQIQFICVKMYARKFVPEKMKSLCIHMITSPIERQLVYKILLALHDQYVEVLKSVHYICLLIISLMLLASFITRRLYLILFITRPLFLLIRCTATGYRQ